MLGLKRGVLAFSEYDSNWSVIFQQERERLMRELKEAVIGIEHTGSTSVEGLFSKPIIDIAITFQGKENLQTIIEKLEMCGYTYKGMHDSKVHWYFVLYEGDITLFHIHAWELPSEYYEKHILFRDNLRKYDFLRDEYAALKRKLAEETGWNRAEYTPAKGEFVERVINYQHK